MGEDGGFDIGVGGVDGGEELVGLRLGNHGGAEGAAGDVARRGRSREAGQALSVEERLALVRRAGDEHDELAMALEGGVEPLAGSAAVGVGAGWLRPARTSACLRLFCGMGMRHWRRGRARAATCGRVAAELDGERFGDGFAGEVVFSGAQAAHEDENVDAGERGADGVDEILLAVADDGFEGDEDADLVELLSEVEGVGVLAEGGEHLGADGDDFGFHE